MKITHTTETRQRKQIETAWDSGQFPATTPVYTPARDKHQLQSHLLCSTASHWRIGCHGQGECTVLGDGASSNTEKHLNRARVAISGTSGGSGLGVVQNSHWCWDCHSPHPNPHWALQPHLLCGAAPFRARATAAEGSAQLWGTEPAQT